MSDEINTSFGVIKIHEDFVVATIFEGIDLDESYVPEIVQILNSNMKKPFGWISNRVNSYSAHPHIVPQVMSKVPLLSSYCGVSYGDPKKDYTGLAKLIAPEGFAVADFSELADAINWTAGIINATTKKA